MDIAWYGHAAFRLRGREAAVVMDPCAPTTGFRLNRPSADIVTVSRGQDTSHNFIDAVALESSGPQRTLDAPGEYEIKRVLATGVRTPGPEGARNVAFIVTIDEVIVAHLGDLQAMPERSAMEELQRADVVLLPCGGGSHLSPEAAASVAGAIAAPLVIPMLYQPEAADAVQTGLEPLSAFMREMGVTAEAPSDNHINVTRSSIPSAPTVTPLLARGA
ncbi:MAG: MBL fold metallo-hydrolase [Chloroflexi bacterium]|nr:MBL fold metallo-hydrolase [Chloroflexota bacterium]MYJ93895.1 MBL fold metallo-hydrolase [Chloroflexota bacterium]